MNKILIVEDDKKISLALAIRLKAKGYQVLAAYDALNGVSLAVKNRPDLILLDISMPAGGGFEVAKRVQDLAPTAGTPIIFMTASKVPGLKEKASELGAVAFFEKPFEAEELVAAIQGVLDESAEEPCSMT